MNPITLKFLDQEIEAKFQKANEDKLKSQVKWLILSMLISGGISTIMEGVNQNYLTFGLYVGFLLLFLFIFLAIEKNSEFALKVIKMFNNVNFSVPAMNLLFSMYNLIEWQTGIAFILLTILYAPLYNSSYNIIQDAIFIVIVSSISIGHISYLIGFTPYYFVIIGPLIQLIYQRYSSIKVERLIFSQSLVNTSLVEVITKVCKENIIIFTYNFEQKNYEKEIINETAQSYFNTDILGDILKEIHIKNETDISSFVFRNCIQQSKRGQLELKGYYKSKTNKILINLYVTQYENIQIILKIQNKYNKMIKIKKAKKFIIFQFQFLQNLLKKFRDKFRIKDRVSQNSEFYDYLRKSLIYNKIQIIQIAKQAQMKIENINLDQMIEYIFSSWNIKYLINSNLNDLPVFLDENQIQNNKGKIQSSSMILELILNVVAIYLRQVVQDHQQFILIELTQLSEQKILLNFHFIQKPQRKSISFVQSSLIKLLSFVGMQDSVEFQENTLSFTVLKQVDQAFEIKNK